MSDYYIWLIESRRDEWDDWRPELDYGHFDDESAAQEYIGDLEEDCLEYRACRYTRLQ